MRKTKVPKRELEICRRFKEMREYLGLTQEFCARQMGIERASVASYESGRTPLKHEIVLRFSHQFIINEEWVATGDMASMKAEASRRKAGWDVKLQELLYSQSMDLLADPICRRIPPGQLFSAAFDTYLAPRYTELVRTFYYVPRIIVSESDTKERLENVMRVYVHRWLTLLGNESLRRNQNPAKVQEFFCRILRRAGGYLFLKLLEKEVDPTRFGPLEAMQGEELVSAGSEKN